jgi:hypothetical protein
MSLHSFQLSFVLCFRRLIDYLLFYVPLKNFSLIWRRHHCRWMAAKFRFMLGAQNLWAGRDLYRSTPAVTRGLGFFGLRWSTAPFSRLLRHTRGCGGSVLTQILTGPHSVASYDKQGDAEVIFLPGPSQVCFRRESWYHVVYSCDAFWDQPGHGASPTNRTQVASRRCAVGAGGLRGE